MNISYLFSRQAPTDKTIVSVSFHEGKDSVVRVGSDGQRVLDIGVEKLKELNRRKLTLLIRRVIQTAKQQQIKKLAIALSDFKFPKARMADAELAELLATNFGMANFEFVKLKTPPPEGWNFITDIFVYGAASVAVKKAFAKGQLISQEVNASRTLANTPGGDMTPKLLAVEAVKAARGTGVKVTVLGKAEMKKLGMGGVLGVAQGSQEEPQFIIMEYHGATKGQKPAVLVGKGVTFDTGGLNLKGDEHMYEMHMDMSGGASVIHSVVLAAKLKLKKNIVALIPSVENMPSGSSFRPGDVLKSLSGKTIEVLNTDAEGRIILADALEYAKRYKPGLVVDVATLTGAAMVALGQEASALFTTDEKMEKLFRALGEESGDYVWPLPLWEEYEFDVKGTFGDVANAQASKTRYGGAINGAMFLYQFAKDLLCPWVHLDIAPRMTATERDFLAKGSAGAPVRLLLKLLERY